MAETLLRLRQRARIHAVIRQFFADRGVLEVCTPILSQAGNTDPNIDSFSCDYIGPKAGGTATRWLRTSPEFFHKRLLAAGSGDIFELGQVFRNGEYGPRHQPEFTLLEWYRIGYTHHQLIDEVLQLLHLLAADFERPINQVRRLTFREWYLDGIGIDPLSGPIEILRAPLADLTIDADALGRDDWLDLLRSHLLEPELADDAILVVDAFPASQAALARINPDDSRTAERFEVYLGRQELANGYHELADADEQRRRFENDLRIRRQRSASQPAVDERLLTALPQMPDCAGVALGVDRLHQWLAGATSIQQISSFGFANS